MYLNFGLPAITPHTIQTCDSLDSSEHGTKHQNEARYYIERIAPAGVVPRLHLRPATGQTGFIRGSRIELNGDAESQMEIGGAVNTRQTNPKFYKVAENENSFIHRQQAVGGLRGSSSRSGE